MEIIVNSSYTVWKSVNHTTNHSLTELTKYLNKYDIDSKEWLENLIEDFAWDMPGNKLAKVDDSDHNIEILDQKVENLSELVDHFSYLIKEEPKQESEFIINCCDGQTGKYCSECGKKLK